MPGLSIIPNSPGSGGFGLSHSSRWTPTLPMPGESHTTAKPASPVHNGFSGSQDIRTIAQIKDAAKKTVDSQARGASSLNLIRAARAQILKGKAEETSGNLKLALGAFTTAASLVQLSLKPPDTSEPNEKRAAFQKEFNDFFAKDSNDMAERLRAVEEKLKAIEKSAATFHGTDAVDDGPVTSSGGSVADRIRSLQDAGMAVNTTKRFSREILNQPTSPTSANRFTHSALSSPSLHISTLTPTTPISSAPSPHQFVLPSSLGPPSPTSSPSSSPLAAHFSVSEFTQAFPPIDELDEMEGLKLPSVPTGSSHHSNSSKSFSSAGKPPLRDPPTPSNAFRNFPPIPIERPSSTPVTPTVNAFVSRPASPSKPSPPSTTADSFNLMSVPSSTPTLRRNGGPDKSGSASPLPVTNTVFPQALYTYMYGDNNLKVLLLDVRPRFEFEREHIKADAVVCVDPAVLLRENLTEKMLDESFGGLPRNEEWVLFMNREKFDLVAIYDDSSITFTTPLSNLVRVIYETVFRKILKRPPMLLIGGLQAWKRDVGDAEVVKGAAEETKLVPNGGHGRNSDNVGSSGTQGVTPPSSDQRTWTQRPRADTDGTPLLQGSMSAEHRSHYSLDQKPLHSRSPAEISYTNGHRSQPSESPQPLLRKPAVSRASISSSPSFSRTLSDNLATSMTPQSMVNGSSSITYPQIPRRISPATSGSQVVNPSSPFISPPPRFDIASPPQASINPTLSRRRSDYIDQSQQALTNSNIAPRPPIDYPELSSQNILRPPPVAASSALERQDNRPRIPHSQAFSAYATVQTGPKPPRIASDYPVTYWSDIQIGTSGLKNLGNTCYMNSTIQCLSAAVPFARFFTDGRWKNAVNYTNPLGSKGKIAGAFAKLVHEIWHGDLPSVTPIEFRQSICEQKAQYRGSDQHDSQEFLSFLLDGIHEDLNRVMVKPRLSATPEQEAELERLPPQIASEREWKTWRTRNDSLIVDFFQGQFRNRLECQTCHQTSTTYNVFSILQLPIPHSRSGKVPLQRCLDAFFNTEVMEKDDAWDCPRCKVKRRATKELSLARLPPVLVIHLKRFESNGRFSDKIDTFVDYPLKSLDFTNFMPPPLPPGVDKGQLATPMSPDDPRTQLPPYKYDLFGVTNHYGSLSSGHYTAYIASRGGWVYCDDQSVKPGDPKQVVNQRAYVLFYKRTKI